MIYETLDIAESPQAAATACAAWLLQELRTLLAGQSIARIAISGGSSPKLMFGTLAKTPFDWSRVHVFWVDERCVPPDDPQSNYKLARRRGSIPPVFLRQTSTESPANFRRRRRLRSMSRKFKSASNLRMVNYRPLILFTAAWVLTPTRRACFRGSR
jgi:hypothetical protein